MKVLIGIAPNDVITYISELYPGSVLDKDVFKANKLKPGDLILADKGCLIPDLDPHGVNVNISPFLVFTPVHPD